MINNVLIRDVHIAQFIKSNSLNFWLIRKINYKIQLNTCKFNNEVKKKVDSFPLIYILNVTLRQKKNK